MLLLLPLLLLLLGIVSVVEFDLQLGSSLFVSVIVCVINVVIIGQTLI
jgi:hypothetical protein